MKLRHVQNIEKTPFDIEVVKNQVHTWQPLPTRQACGQGISHRAHLRNWRQLQNKTDGGSLGTCPHLFSLSVNLIQMESRGLYWFTSGCFCSILLRAAPGLPCGPELPHRLAPWVPEWDTPP